MTSFLTEAFDVKVQNLLKKITYKKRSFYVLCLHRSTSPITGNKAWKLKYNLEDVRRRNKQGVLTFGGSYSNHIYQTAKICNAAGLQSIGIIRGEILDDNPTMEAVKAYGMEIIPVSRTEYRKRLDSEYINHLQAEFPSFVVIPEGGTNSLAIKGTMELGKQIKALSLDYSINQVGVAVGTGGTIAGIIRGLGPDIFALGFGALKGDFLANR